MQRILHSYGTLACRYLLSSIFVLFVAMPSHAAAQEPTATATPAISTETSATTAPASQPTASQSTASQSIVVDPQKAAQPEPLHVVIDRMLGSSLPHLTARAADEGLFLRRLSIDLRGTVPTGEELKAYLADTNPDKRTVWVDKFLADPLHQERMADWLDKTLMMRRPFTNVQRAEWIELLRETVASKLPLHQQVAKMLTAPWWDNTARPQLRFFLDRSGDPHLITRDLSRVLLGRDMQCNQCHNHPLVEEYKQIDYHGMLAFVSGSGLVEITTKNDKGADVKTQMYVERPGANAPFESVFEKGVPFRTGPRLPVSPEIAETYLDPDARLSTEAKPGALAGLPTVPVHSRRQMLADELIQKQARVLARNFANRLWAMCFARGIVHPVDMHHADNPPTHPELLELLTSSLMDMQFDADKLLRELVLTDAYHRSSDIDLQIWPLTPNAPLSAGSQEIQEIASAAASRKEKLSNQLIEAKKAEEQSESALETASAAWRTAQAARHAALAELDKGEAAFNDVKKKSDAAATAHATAKKKRQDADARIALLDEAGAKIQQAITLAGADDAELKAAIATSKAKADAVRNDLANLDKAIADTKTAADTALAALDAPRAKLKELVAVVNTQNQALTPLDVSYAQARQTWAQKRSDVVRIEREIERCDHALKLAEHIAAARSAVAEIDQGQLQLAAAQSMLPAVEEPLNKLNTALAEVAKAHEAANAQLAVKRQALASHEGELAQLRETIKLLEKSTSLVTMPEALAKAAAAINETLANKTSLSGQYQSEVAEHEKIVAESATKLAQATTLRDQSEKARNELLADIKSKTDAQQARQARLDEAKAKADEAWQLVLEDQRTMVQSAAFRPLSPEQFGLSILRVTNVFDNYVNTEIAELAKKAPLAADADEQAQAIRRQQAVRGAADKLRGNIDVFANLYSSGVGQTADDFFASPDQALYMSNAGSVFSWSAASGQNIAGRIVSEKDNLAAANDLYLTLLGRKPTDAEAAFVNEQLSAAADKRAPVAQELVWAILTGVEFRFYR